VVISCAIPRIQKSVKQHAEYLDMTDWVEGLQAVIVPPVLAKAIAYELRARRSQAGYLFAHTGTERRGIESSNTLVLQRRVVSVQPSNSPLAQAQLSTLQY
jgi:hypothetical protein